MKNKRLIMERKVRLGPEEVVEFQEELRRRNWARMGAYPNPVNIAVLKEFYVRGRWFFLMLLLSIPSWELMKEMNLVSFQDPLEEDTVWKIFEDFVFSWRHHCEKHGTTSIAYQEDLSKFLGKSLGDF